MMARNRKNVSNPHSRKTNDTTENMTTDLHIAQPISLTGSNNVSEKSVGPSLVTVK